MSLFTHTAINSVARPVILSSLVISGVVALQFLVWPTSAAAHFHKTLKELAKDPGRLTECAQGDTKTVRKIVSHTINNAKEKYKLAGLTNDADTKRAEKELYDFLNWKMGSVSAVCGQYASGGQKHFNNGYSDEAAYALLGHELPGAGRPKYRLPKKISEQLKAQIKSCADQVVAAVAGKAPASSAPTSQTPPSTSVTDKLTAQAMEKVSTACQQQVAKLRQQLEKEYNIPPELRDAAIKEISKAAVAGVKAVDRIAFDVPQTKRFDIDDSVVHQLVADRRAEKGVR